MTRHTLLVAALFSATALVAGVAGSPATAVAAPPATPAHPWQYDHWPQQQPWQTSAPGAQPAESKRVEQRGFPAPIDPQNWQNPDDMTWADYRKPPHTDWVDPSKEGSVRQFRGALVLTDYPNQSFVVTQPQNSTVFGNPTAEAHDIPRADVARYYQDFLNTPGTLNHGHTIHEYWMEDSGGRYGVNLTGFGPYQLPGKSYEYAMEFQGDTGCPAGDSCDRDIRTDARDAWVADVGEDVANGFDFVFFLSAGQDESSTWQEFGPMKFPAKEDVTDEFGPPDDSLPNWVDTRYVDWTSWAAGSTIWPNAGGGTSTQAESSGQSTYAHEFSHILGIGDNYNNPFSIPARRDYSGPWEMLSRGTFNGPGGPHSRWMIPATGGSAMGAQHMLRNKVKLEMVDEQNVLRLSREALADSGMVIARVTARSVQPGRNDLSGINVQLGTGDLDPACDVDTDPFCDGGGYNNYTVEVVDRMGSDSFTPDAGVLLAKTKDEDRAPFEWVIDANPQDIGMTDYVLPDGTPVPITIGDYRQLADSLFHAGTNSGSEYEYTDEANRLHFYVLDVRRNGSGELAYTVAVKSLDGAGPQRHGVAVLAAAGQANHSGLATCKFPLVNTGRSAASAGQHPEEVRRYLNGDVYRLSATVDGRGWTVDVPNQLASADFGRDIRVPVYALRSGSGSRVAKVTLTASSESDPSKADTATCTVRSR